MNSVHAQKFACWSCCPIAGLLPLRSLSLPQQAGRLYPHGMAPEGGELPCAMHISWRVGFSRACSHSEMSVADTQHCKSCWLPRHQAGLLCDAKQAAPGLSRPCCHSSRVPAALDTEAAVPTCSAFLASAGPMTGRKAKLSCKCLSCLPGGAVYCTSGHTLASTGFSAAMKWVWLPHCTLKTQPFLLRLSNASSVLSTCLQSRGWLRFAGHTTEAAHHLFWSS